MTCVVKVLWNKSTESSGLVCGRWEVALEMEQMFDYVERSMRNREVYYSHFRVCTNALSGTFQEMQQFLNNFFCPLKYIVVTTPVSPQIFLTHSILMFVSTHCTTRMIWWKVFGRGLINLYVTLIWELGGSIFIFSGSSKTSFMGNTVGVSHTWGWAEGHGIGALGCHRGWHSMEPSLKTQFCLKFWKPEAMTSARTALGKAQWRTKLSPNSALCVNSSSLG